MFPYNTVTHDNLNTLLEASPDCSPIVYKPPRYSIELFNPMNELKRNKKTKNELKHKFSEVVFPNFWPLDAGILQI